MSDIDVLEVYAEDRWVGTLFDEQPLRFRYADARQIVEYASYSEWGISSLTA